MIAEVSFLVRFPYPEKLKIGNFKHVRKLILAVENSDCRLVSDGQSIIGVAGGVMPKCRITARFPRRIRFPAVFRGVGLQLFGRQLPFFEPQAQPGAARRDLAGILARTFQ